MIYFAKFKIDQGDYVKDQLIGLDKDTMTMFTDILEYESHYAEGEMTPEQLATNFLTTPDVREQIKAEQVKLQENIKKTVTSIDAFAFIPNFIDSSKITPEIRKCMAAKVELIFRRNPTWTQDKVLKMAFEQCS